MEEKSGTRRAEVRVKEPVTRLCLSSDCEHAHWSVQAACYDGVQHVISALTPDQRKVLSPRGAVLPSHAPQTATKQSQWGLLHRLFFKQSYDIIVLSIWFD